MKIVYLILFAFCTGLHAANLNRNQVCEKALTEYPRFKFGQVTDKNETAEAYFASPVTNLGQPRMVIMVGLPGSGKTTWSKHADATEWETVSVDEIRTEILKQLKRDPTKSHNHIGEYADEEVIRLTGLKFDKTIENAIALGRGIILDQNNLTPIRAFWSNLGHSRGYHVEALIFSSKNVDTNLSNVRSRQGEISEGFKSGIRNRLQQFEFFNQHIRVGNKVKVDHEISRDIYPYLKLSKTYSNLQQALIDMNPEDRLQMEGQLQADYFDSVRFVWTPNLSEMPHDTPVLRKSMRIYAALTNKCNRACPWCCVYSNPNKNTFLEPEQLAPHFPKTEIFDLQLEGGEPTIHPKLFSFVDIFRASKNAGRLILITNGVKLPRNEVDLKKFILKFGRPFTIKLSINHYLLEKDKLLIEKAKLLREVIESVESDYELIFNVRLRRGQKYNNDSDVLKLVRDAGLESYSNIFFLQSYGLASNETEWEAPFTVNDGFKLVNPDGTIHTGTLEERANKMGELK